MKPKKFFALLITALFSFVTAGRHNYAISRTDDVKAKVVQRVNNAAKAELGDTDDPQEIFTRAIARYQNTFSDYLNITALNVDDKEAVVLPGFDVSYTAPQFSQVLHDYQAQLESSLSPTQLQNYEYLRRTEYYFDRYVTLNQIYYSDLNAQLKYSHSYTPLNPLSPITPGNPGTSPSAHVSTRRAAEVATAEILEILYETGIADSAITAFSSCISTMTIALSTSWVPVIGWPLAVSLVVGALVTIVLIIVMNWDSFCQVIGRIRTWFLVNFFMFGYQINTLFDDACAKGKESKVAHRIQVGGKTLDFLDTIVTEEMVKKITDEGKRNDRIFLMGHIGNANSEKGKHWWFCYEEVDEKFVTDNKLYDRGVCTYTWYNNRAKRMMARGATIINGDYRLLIYDRTIDQGDLFGWNHYHIGIKKGDKLVKYEGFPERHAHSMFGLLRIRGDGGYDSYPVNP